MLTLQSLFVSKVREKVLQVFLKHPREIYHVRGLVRETKEEINAVRRELARMDKYGLVKKEARGNRIYYWLDDQSPFYPELVSLVAKTTGLGRALLKNKNKLGKIDFVMFSGRFARHLPRQRDNEVDLLLVGKADLEKLSQLVKKEEVEKSREINYTVMDREEFSFRKKRRDPFILAILLGSRIMIIGEEEKLVAMKPMEEE